MDKLTRAFNARNAALRELERHPYPGPQQRDAIDEVARTEAAFQQALQRDREEREAEVSIWMRLALFVGLCLVFATGIVLWFHHG